jgi:hypothetical protein
LTEHFDASPKMPRGRGRAQATDDLIEVMAKIAEEMEPITVRGIAYKLFVRKLIASMAKGQTNKVSRLLTIARDEGIIPWEYIVDETRELESQPTWADPQEYAEATRRSYRRDRWQDQPHRVWLVSEKNTVRGVLAPVLDKFGVPFQPMHGFTSTTKAHEIAEDDDGRELILLYVGAYDPSGLHMSEVDLPKRLEKYGGDHVTIRRIALTRSQARGLPSFPAKRSDPRYNWFMQYTGGDNRCWELDAMDPRELRRIVEREIKALIEPEAWNRSEVCEDAELESLNKVMGNWVKAARRPTRSNT